MHQIQKDLLALSRNINLADKSLRELGRLIGVDHPEKVKHHLQQLEKKGFIMFDYTTNKYINVNKKIGIERNFINVPIVGSANCGPAKLLAEENIEGFLKISPTLIKNNTKVMAIKAQGESMNRARIKGNSIDHGDYVIVDYSNKAPFHGDYVLAIIDDAATIKRFYDDKDNHQVMLVAESTMDIPPMIIDELDFENFLINGVVLKVIKKPKFD